MIGVFPGAALQTDSFLSYFGRWQAAEDGVAYGLAGDGSGIGDMLWRCDLPSDVRQARQALERIENEQRLAFRQVEDLPRQIERILQIEQGRASFEAGSSQALSPAENEFLAAVQEFDSVTFRVSFEVYARLPGNWPAVFARFQAALDEIQGLLSRYARVETRVGGALLGRTLINLKGDLRTQWTHPYQAQAGDLHLRSVQQALASRLAMIQTLSSVVQGAVLAAALAGAPGSAVLLLPAVWKYARSLIVLTNKTNETV
jgi:hypothetical protein